MTTRWRTGRRQLPAAAPRRTPQMPLPPRIATAGGGHGQPPRQPVQVQLGGRLSPHDEPGAAAPSEASGAGLRRTPRYYDTPCAPGTAPAAGLTAGLLTRMCPAGSAGFAGLAVPRL